MRERERERDDTCVYTLTYNIIIVCVCVCTCAVVTCFLEGSWCCSFRAFLRCLSRALQSSDMCYQLSATMPTAKQACIDTLVPFPPKQRIVLTIMII